MGSSGFGNLKLKQMLAPMILKFNRNCRAFIKLAFKLDCAAVIGYGVFNDWKSESCAACFLGMALINTIKPLKAVCCNRFLVTAATCKPLEIIPTPKYKTNINCFRLGILTWYVSIWYRLSQFYEVFLLLLSNSYHLDAIKNSVNKYLLHSIRFQLSQYAINRFHNRLQKSSW